MPPLARNRTRPGGSTGIGSGWAERLQLFLLVSYGAYYAWLAFGLPIETVVNGTVDDSYYYLVVARNIAAGLGSTFDGTNELTNGYHPLWMGLLVPLCLLAKSPEPALRLTLLLSGALSIGMLAFLRRTLNDAVGPWATLAMLVLFAWPRFLGLTQNGLETALLLLLYAVVIDALVRGRFATTSQRVGFGLLLGFTMLARLDSVFLILAAGLWALVEWARGGSFWSAFAADSRTQREERSATAASRLLSHLPLLAAALPVVPYLFWNLAVFGHLQPVSGAMKTTFPEPGFHPAPLRDFPEYGLLTGVALLAVLIGLRPGASRFARALGLLALAALLHAAYTIVFMVWAVDRWQFGLLVVLGLTALPAAAGQILARLPRPLATGAVIAAIAGAVVVQAYSLRLREGRYQSETYRLALWAREHLPKDAMLSATDSGVIAFFSERPTVNLDGLINSFDYLECVQEGGGRVEEYLERKGVDYLLDQNAFGRPDLLSGQYEVRICRIAYRPEGRITAELPVRRGDEVHRRDVMSRNTLGSTKTEPNAVILYRYDPEFVRRHQAGNAAAGGTTPGSDRHEGDAGRNAPARDTQEDTPGR